MSSGTILTHLKNGDISDIIYAEKKLHSVVKAEFKQYHEVYHQLHKRNYKGNHQSQLVISEDSALDDLSVEISLKQLVLERESLRSSVIVLPVFSKYVLTYLSENKVCRSLLSLNESSHKAILFHNQAKLLNIFLEWSLENKSFANIALNETRQIMIPFLIDEHYTIAVVKLTKSSYNKFAHIQFYNSYGTNLDEVYQESLKLFFKKHAFIAKFENKSKLEQRDDHNCGIFVIYKAIEIASHNVGVQETLLPCHSLDLQNYKEWAVHARSHIAHILYNQNINVSLSLSS
jgi:hypothetical protein